MLDKLFKLKGFVVKGLSLVSVSYKLLDLLNVIIREMFYYFAIRKYHYKK